MCGWNDGWYRCSEEVFGGSRRGLHRLHRLHRIKMVSKRCSFGNSFWSLKQGVKSMTRCFSVPLETRSDARTITIGAVNDIKGSKGSKADKDSAVLNSFGSAEEPIDEVQTIYQRPTVAAMLDGDSRPKDLVDQKWDAAIDLTLRRVVYSTAGGAIAAIALFRSPTTRWSAIAFGAGLGLGSAIRDSSYILKNDAIWPFGRISVAEDP